VKVNRKFLQVQRPNNGSVAGSSDGDKVGGGTVPAVPSFTPAAAIVVQELELLCAKPSETGSAATTRHQQELAQLREATFLRACPS
jgi:hypothetical protein